MNTNDELIENTVATEQNTLATVNSTPGNGGINKLTAAVLGLTLATVCFISYINEDFATQQAAVVLGGIVGVVGGASLPGRK